MTWNEFKQHIDAQLRDMDISGDEEIWFIDTTFPKADSIGVNDGGMDNPVVALNPICGLQIS